MSNTTTTRIWESPQPNDSPTANNSSRGGQLPSIATLTNNLPAGTPAQVSSPVNPPNNRDSDQWPSQPQSTRSSAYSSGFNYYQSSGLSSPHRASNSSQLATTSHPADYPFANSQSSPGFAPHHQSLGLPNLNQYADGSQYRNSHEFPPQESRRSSLGSQVNNGFNNLHLNGAPSPYAGSTNASQSSIALSLQRERHPAVNGLRNSRASSNMQQPMSPLSPLPGESRQAFSSRTAPVISANPIREVYNADKPTAGQPYAFPDPDMSNRSSGSADDPRSAGTAMSRRNSDHTSVTSSIFTTDSRLPPGQHRLDDEMSGTHHHTLQHKQVSQLTGESDSPDATSPYSRTPALRASHKLAERKRRTEMKYLFDGLRNQIPASHGSKASKWEILSKASDYIKSLESSNVQGRQAQEQLSIADQELLRIRRENDSLRHENHRLFQEMEHYRNAPPPAASHAPPMVYGSQADPSRSLPPLSNGAPTGMQGVQYTDERR